MGRGGIPDASAINNIFSNFYSHSENIVTWPKAEQWKAANNPSKIPWGLTARPHIIIVMIKPADPIPLHDGTKAAEISSFSLSI